MAELAMVTDIQQTVYPEVTRQLHIMVQGRESSPVIERRSNQLCYATNTSSRSSQHVTGETIATKHSHTDSQCPVLAELISCHQLGY